jgi:hypothetical protein
MEPLEIGRLSRPLLGPLALDLGVRSGLAVDAGVGIVVVRPLRVEADVDDRSVLPPNVLGVQRVEAALVRLPRERQRLSSEALVRRREERAPEREPLQRIEDDSPTIALKQTRNV